MTTSNNTFERILQEVMRKKQILEDLVSENRALRQQLTDLRNGRGIFIDMEGTRFALRLDQSAASEPITSTATVQDQDADLTATSAEPEATETASPPMVIPTTPPLDLTQGEPADDASSESEDEEQAEKDARPSFLEAIMLDEFTKIATSPLHSMKTSNRSKSTTRLEAIHVEVAQEQEKAEIRKALTGSYLLE